MGLQKLAKIPLLIAVDQEGGLINRLKEGFTIFPGNLALAKTGQPELAEKCAFAIGQELLSFGVNMNLAPVIDINNNPYNPVIGIRSFGDTADQVTLFAKHALQGYRRAGIITCLKHFPGHGDVVVDSHQDLPVVRKTKEELTKLELFPFYQYDCSPSFSLFRFPKLRYFISENFNESTKRRNRISRSCHF